MKDDVEKDDPPDKRGDGGRSSEGHYLLRAELGLGFFLLCDPYFLLRAAGIPESPDAGLLATGVGAWMTVHSVITLRRRMRLSQR